MKIIFVLVLSVFLTGCGSQDPNEIVEEFYELLIYSDLKDNENKHAFLGFTTGRLKTKLGEKFEYADKNEQPYEMQFIPVLGVYGNILELSDVNIEIEKEEFVEKDGEVVSATVIAKTSGEIKDETWFSKDKFSFTLDNDQWRITKIVFAHEGGAGSPVSFP
ncbi:MULTISPECIES: hypothetical protein [unclassified Oleiphilus]|uniref:hypothetical protein n=1 Tax=unclassified Oleiphilus TaxID=2631174 RepID=UPI0007C3080F|nr:MULTISPECIES: hypothetical protein [unclassified Oleiphilus]KZY34046.1 hypothetical protein A3729_18480 [Oleiphilus sp. HI0043]KZZ66993.1 hypothetical protein A3763_16695 [Oleiphilus sp. HI0128]